jgi:hypothetical protein
VKLWLDDVRPAPTGWTRVRWPSEAIELLAMGCVAEVSLDHDLGDDQRGTGYDVLLWIERAVAQDSLDPPRIHLHTANPAALDRMRRAVQQIDRLAQGGVERGCDVAG